MLLCLQANIHSLSGSTFFCPRLWMMLTLSKSRVRVWVTVPVSLSWLITAPAQNTDCINQATFLIPVYVLTIYPLLLVLSLLENLRETEIGAVMLEIFIPKIFFSNNIYQIFFLHFLKKWKEMSLNTDINLMLMIWLPYKAYTCPKRNRLIIFLSR